MKKQTKADRVRALDNSGATAQQIADKAGCDISYVYMVRYMDKKKGKATAAPKRKPGRPRKVKFVPSLSLTQHLLDDMKAPPVPVVVPVQTRFSLKERFVILFTGRASAWTAR